MKNAVIVCALVLFGSVCHPVQCTDWVDEVTKSIIEHAECRQVKLMTRLNDNEVLENPLIEELYTKLMKSLPPLRINFGADFKLPENSVPDWSNATRTPIDTSATLFLFVIESRDSLPIPMAKRFIDAVAEMASYHYSPKYLLVTSLRTPSYSFKEIMEYAWTKKILDFTILELNGSQWGAVRSSILINRSNDRPFIHHFNPFKNEYTKKIWTALMITLFPNKLTDMSGYPMRILPVNVPPYILAGFNGSAVTSVGGPNSVLMLILLQSLNATPEYDAGLRRLDSSDLLRYVYIFTQLRDIDVIPFLASSYTPSWNDSQRTFPIMYSQFCYLVPIIPTSENAFSVQASPTFLLSIGIILIFWIFMRLLRIKSYSSKIFTIGRVLFGVSVRQQPVNDVERIIFACLLALSAIYSSTIYTAMTDVALGKAGEVPFESFEDLVNSELMIGLSTFNMDRTAHLLHKELNISKDKVLPKWDSIDCIQTAIRDKNVTCFIPYAVAKLGIKEFEKQGLRIVKIGKPFLWNEVAGFVTGKRSPYRSVLDKKIMRLHETGIIQKIYKDVRLGDILNFNYSDSNISNTGKTDDPTGAHALLLQLMFVAVIGYSASFVVFILEILYDRISKFISKRKNRQRRIRVRCLAPPRINVQKFRMTPQNTVRPPLKLYTGPRINR